jgi:CheY-like chemotaxis protein
MAIREAVIGPTVLVVESKPVIRSSIAASLTEAGFKVLEAQSTGDAWTALEARPDIRVLFADLDDSNEADSLEFTRNVHDRWPFIGLVITSVHVRHLRPDDIPGNGCFLPRPLPADTLLYEVNVAAQRIAA